MTPILSILIPTTPDRWQFLNRLLTQLYSQIQNNPVEVLIEADNKEKTVGEKRNILVNRAQGEYVVHIDSDDRISDKYISLIMEGLITKPTHCSLRGMYYSEGVPVKPFIHSTDYDSYWENTESFFRVPNHLNTVRRDIVLQVPFPDWKLSEDTNFALRMYNTGLLTKEYKINEILYHYEHIQDK